MEEIATIIPTTKRFDPTTTAAARPRDPADGAVVIILSSPVAQCSQCVYYRYYCYNISRSAAVHDEEEGEKKKKYIKKLLH